MATTYNPAEDVSKELNADGLKAYQEMIGILQWSVDIGGIDILLEVSLIFLHLALPRVSHLQSVYRVFGYLKQVPKRRLFFDPPDLLLSRRKLVNGLGILACDIQNAYLTEKCKEKFGLSRVPSSDSKKAR